MTAKAAAGAWRPARRGTAAVVGFAALTALALVTANAAMPYLVRRNTLTSEVAAQLRTTVGIAIATRQARFDLLPLPRVTLLGVRASDPSGALVITAERLDGEVRLLPLIVGRIELATIRLEKAHITVNLDTADALLTQAFRREEPSQVDATRRFGALTLIDATLDLSRNALRIAPTVAISVATLDWRAPDAPAMLNASLVAGSTAVDFAAWVADPGGLTRRERSAVALRLHSPAGDLSASGDLRASGLAGVPPRAVFRGRTVASAPSLAALAGAFGTDRHLPAPFADLTLDAGTVLTLDHDGVSALDLADLDLRADGNAFEGTLAFSGGPKPLVSGTLATTRLSLTPLLQSLPAIAVGTDRWSEEPIGPLRFGAPDFDLRVSASRLQLAALTLKDAALSVLSRSDRIEIGLSDGKAYGGDVKGRVSVGRTGEDLSLRAAGALTGADLAGLSWDAFGRQLATGSLSATANVESHGGSIAELMRRLQGWARMQAVDGELSGRDIKSSSRAAGSDRTTSPSQGRMPFSALHLGARIVDGRTTLDEGKLQLPNDLPAQVTGSIDLGARRLNLGAVVHAPDLPDQRVTLRGGFDAAAVAVEDVQPALP